MRFRKKMSSKISPKLAVWFKNSLNSFKITYFPVLCLALVRDCMPILLRLRKKPPLCRLGNLSSEDHRMTLAAEDLGGGGSVVPLYVEEDEEAEVWLRDDQLRTCPLLWKERTPWGTVLDDVEEVRLDGRYGTLIVTFPVPLPWITPREIKTKEPSNSQFVQLMYLNF